MIGMVKRGLLVSLLCLGLAACGDAPEDVAEDFVLSLAKADFDRAMELSTAETAVLLGMFKGAAGKKPEGARDKDVAFKALGTRIDGDTAVVTFVDENNGKEDTLSLKKVDGDWKVAMKK